MTDRCRHDVKNSGVLLSFIEEIDPVIYYSKYTSSPLKVKDNYFSVSLHIDINCANVGYCICILLVRGGELHSYTVDGTGKWRWVTVRTESIQLLIFLEELIGYSTTKTCQCNLFVELAYIQLQQIYAIANHNAFAIVSRAKDRSASGYCSCL